MTNNHLNVLRRHLKEKNMALGIAHNHLTRAVHLLGDVRLETLALQAELDALRAAARLVLDRCTAQDFDRGAIAEALNVLAAHLPDDVLLADMLAIGFVEENEQ